MSNRNKKIVVVLILAYLLYRYWKNKPDIIDPPDPIDPNTSYDCIKGNMQGSYSHIYCKSCKKRNDKKGTFATKKECVDSLCYNQNFQWHKFQQSGCGKPWILAGSAMQGVILSARGSINPDYLGNYATYPSPFIKAGSQDHLTYAPAYNHASDILFNWINNNVGTLNVGDVLHFEPISGEMGSYTGGRTLPKNKICFKYLGVEKGKLTCSENFYPLKEDLPNLDFKSTHLIPIDPSLMKNWTIYKGANACKDCETAI